MQNKASFGVGTNMDEAAVTYRDEELNMSRYVPPDTHVTIVDNSIKPSLNIVKLIHKPLLVIPSPLL
jgi:hypothetical protein